MDAQFSPTVLLRPPTTISSFRVPNRPDGELTVVAASRISRPPIRSASVTIIEEESVRVSSLKNRDRIVLNQLRLLLKTESDDGVLERVRSLSNLEQEYCSQLIVTHEKQKELDKAIAAARKRDAQHKLQIRIDNKDRDLDCLQRRAARLDAFNRDVLARVAVRTAQHSETEKRILRSRIEQQNRTIRELERQLKNARTIQRGWSLNPPTVRFNR